MTTITMDRKQPMKTGCDCENEASQGNIYKDVILRELSTVVLLNCFALLRLPISLH